MVRKTLLLLVASFVLQASAAEKLPVDVKAFINDREGCDHMRGEIPDSHDEGRMKEVGQEIDKLCKGTDHRLAGLKRKYASNRNVMRHLDQFESQIEASVPMRHR